MRKLAFVLLAACGGSDHHGPVTLEPDAAIDSPPPKQPVTLELDVYGSTPVLVAYRDGSGAWQNASGGDQGKYAMTVTDDYQVVVACNQNGDVQSTQISATVDDPAQSAFCTSPGTDSPTPVVITGTMKQAGAVYLETTASSQTANWNISMSVSPRTHDLVAVDNQHRILIRRGLDLTADSVLDPLDLTGAPTMTPITLQVANLGSDSLSTSLDLMTANDYVAWDSSTTQLWGPPDSLLGSSDYRYLYAMAYAGSQYRWSGTEFTGTETSFTLPDPLTAVTFSGTTASWTTLPAYDQVELDLDSTINQHQIMQTVLATKRWVDAKHATSLAFDAQPPGWQTGWNIDTSSYGGNFYAFHSDAHGGSGSALYHSVGARVAQRPNLPRLSTVERLRESIRSQHTMPRK